MCTKCNILVEKEEGWHQWIFKAGNSRFLGYYRKREEKGLRLSSYIFILTVCAKFVSSSSCIYSGVIPSLE